MNTCSSRFDNTLKISVRFLSTSFIALVVLFCSAAQVPVAPDACQVKINSENFVYLPAPLPKEQIVKHHYYSLSFNDQYNVPNWVAYDLNGKMLSGHTSRTNNFRMDPELGENSPRPSDYSHSHYDKGHMLPAGDMVFSPLAMSETFFMSNMCPQTPECNRGIWKRLEEQVRSWAIMYDDLFITAGPILNGNMKELGEDHVAVPGYFYKVILDGRKPNVKAIGFIIPNENSDLPLENFAVSVDSVEKLSHIDFFPELPDSTERRVESTTRISDWNFISSGRSGDENKIEIHGLPARCKAITHQGTRCKRSTTYSNGFCSQHGGK